MASITTERKDDAACFAAALQLARGFLGNFPELRSSIDSPVWEESGERLARRYNDAACVEIIIPLGMPEPLTCEVDQPNGLSAGELLAEAQARLLVLLTEQHNALPSWANSDACLAHEITNTLRHIQRLAATPCGRCLA